jgi:hypothetical protein
MLKNGTERTPLYSTWAETVCAIDRLGLEACVCICALAIGAAHLGLGRTYAGGLIYSLLGRPM